MSLICHHLGHIKMLPPAAHAQQGGSVPKPRGIPSCACSGTPNLQKAKPRRCLALTTRGVIV